MPFCHALFGIWLCQMCDILWKESKEWAIMHIAHIETFQTLVVSGLGNSWCCADGNALNTVMYMVCWWDRWSLLLIIMIILTLLQYYWYYLSLLGMNKIVVNHLEKLFVTNDAATILKELEVCFVDLFTVIMLAFGEMCTLYASGQEICIWKFGNVYQQR